MSHRLWYTIRMMSNKDMMKTNETSKRGLTIGDEVVNEKKQRGTVDGFNKDGVWVNFTHAYILVPNEGEGLLLAGLPMGWGLRGDVMNISDKH